MEDARRVTAMLSLFNIKENAEIFWEWGRDNMKGFTVVGFGFITTIGFMYAGQRMWLNFV